MNTILNLLGFGSVVKTKILDLLDAKIKLAEKDFANGVKEIKEDLKFNLLSAKMKAEVDTEFLLKETVKKVISDLVN